MKQKAAGILTVGVALTGMLASAETVAWYHFDEAPAGTRTTADSAIVDSIHPAKTPGYVRTFLIPNKTSYWKQPTIGTEPAELLPFYTNGFPEVVAAFDPVTQKMYHSPTALRTVSSDPTASTRMDGSIVYLNDDVSYYTGSFTIELFIRVSPDIPTGYLYVLDKHVTGRTWDAGNRFVLRLQSRCPVFEIVTSDGTFATAQSTGIGDGKWHHIALVVDDDKKEIAEYVDRGGKQVKAYTGTIDWTDAEPITLGASPHHYDGLLQCQFAELRISDTALTSDQFLTPRVRAPASELTDENTLLYVNFEGALDTLTPSAEVAGLSTAYVPALMNRAPYRTDFSAEGLEFQWGKGNSPTNFTRAITNDVRYSCLRIGESLESVTNTSACWLGKYTADETVKTPSLAIPVDSPKIYKDSFTIEYFVKWGTEPYTRAASGYRYLMDNDHAVMMYSVDGDHIKIEAGGKVVPMLSDSGEFDAVTTSRSYRDNKWHHFAFVYDKDAETFDFYIDYRKMGHVTDPDFVTNVPASGGTKMVFLGYYAVQTAWADYSIHAASNAMFDELRITRGVLSKDEFLRDPKKGLMLLLR